MIKLLLCTNYISNKRANYFDPFWAVFSYFGVLFLHTPILACNFCTIDELPLASYVLPMARTFLNRKFRYTYNNVTFYLIIANVAFYLLAFISPRINNYLAMIPPLIIQRHWYWQFFTYMFVHGGLGHLFFNMLGLYMFGMPVERKLGSREFLLIYLLVGTLSGIFSFIAYFLAGQAFILVGASGAIYGLLLAFAVLFPRARVLLFGIIPIRAPVLVIGYTFLEIFNQVSGSRQGVAHLTHLAGFAFAYLYFVVRLKIKPLQEWRR